MYDIPPEFFFTKVKNEKLEKTALIPLGKQSARRRVNDQSMYYDSTNGEYSRKLLSGRSSRKRNRESPERAPSCFLVCG